MIVEADGFVFDFSDALNAFVFDETDKAKSTYHGLPMKAVDIVAEFNNMDIYVEIKDFHEPKRYNKKQAENDDETREKLDNFKYLKNTLKYKYRDSYLFRHAEQKADKPIHYICLLTFENALNVTMQKGLAVELPVGVASIRWKQAVVESCQVVNLDKWNKNFPRWPVHRVEYGKG